RRTFDIARKMYYVRGFWLVKSSDLPETLNGPLPPLLLGRSTARYDPRYLPLQRELETPSAQTIAVLIQEKREATELCDLSLADLASARGALKASDYQDLEQRLRQQRL